MWVFLPPPVAASTHKNPEIYSRSMSDVPISQLLAFWPTFVVIAIAWLGWAEFRRSFNAPTARNSLWQNAEPNKIRNATKREKSEERPYPHPDHRHHHSKHRSYVNCGKTLRNRSFEDYLFPKFPSGAHGFRSSVRVRVKAVDTGTVYWREERHHLGNPKSPNKTAGHMLPRGGCHRWVPWLFVMSTAGVCVCANRLMWHCEEVM